ncbi:MAG TPA: Mut7-C RNAse domain-containing protein [Anaerolineae bacterium]|nr:Mut7-C RNAse domain-containing protein [Anaerolineae bacterium]
MDDTRPDSEDQREPARLIADVMLGRLAKWLRLMGYDTRYDNAAEDVTLLRIAQQEDRILLTRDRGLSRQRGVRAIWIESQELAAQIRQVQAAVGPPADGALTRCAVCNTRLEPIAKADVEDRVPPYVLQTQDEFCHCPQCGRIYWAATHVDRMKEMIGALK